VNVRPSHRDRTPVLTLSAQFSGVWLVEQQHLQVGEQREGEGEVELGQGAAGQLVGAVGGVAFEAERRMKLSARANRSTCSSQVSRS
jgi:hypothetical protein